MLKKSMFWRTMYNAWDLICDYRLPAVLRPEPERENFRNESFNVLYALPLWGAAAGIIALILWKPLRTLLDQLQRKTKR